MGLGGPEYTLVHVPLAAGLDQKLDPRALEPPALDIALDIQFDLFGGIQTRKPFTAGGLNLVGGGTVTNPRRLAVVDDELLLFSDTALYSWNEEASAWQYKADHAAVAVDEATRFETTDDQIMCDRAELNGTIVFAWTNHTDAYVAAVDKATGEVVCPPKVVGSGNTTPRLVALQTKILLFVVSGGDLEVRVIDPANAGPSGILAGTLATVVAAATFNVYYDVVAIPGADSAIGACRNQTTTAHTVFSVTAAATVATSTKARTSSSAIAVSPTPDGVSVQVLRNDTALKGDLLTISTLADTAHVGVTVASPGGDQIAAAHQTVKVGGQYRCYAFWSNHATDGDDETYRYTSSNWIDTSGAIGTAALFVGQVQLGSRAFDHGGRVYLWLAFVEQNESIGSTTTIDGQLQNTYFLYRDDALLVAKCAEDVAGAQQDDVVAGEGFPLPGVALVDGTTEYAWCATEARIITVGGGTTALASSQKAYADRAPRDVTISFDDNDARRIAQIGPTAYMPGGLVLQYDGIGLYELGFEIFPWWLDVSNGGSGSIAAGTYAYKGTFRWQNGRGEIDRSTTANVAERVALASTENIIQYSRPLTITRKLPPSAASWATGSAVTLEYWRTKVNPTADAPFFLVSGLDPSTTAGSNAYVPNDPTASSGLGNFTDKLADASIAVNQQDPETDGVLENLAPPAARLMIATEDRVFLGDVAGDPDRVWYSKQRIDGQVVAFHDALVFPVPRPGGRMRALGVLNEVPVVWRERAIYSCPGVGDDNTGAGDGFGPARIVSSDCGAVNQESIALTETGYVFKSDKGWYLLAKDWSVRYIGDKVSGYDAEEPLSVEVMTSEHHVRIVTANRVLIWDYLVEQWAEWTIAGALDAVVWQGKYVYLDPTNGAMVQESDYTTVAAVATITDPMTGAVVTVTAASKTPGPEGNALSVAWTTGLVPNAETDVGNIATLGVTSGATFATVLALINQSSLVSAVLTGPGTATWPATSSVQLAGGNGVAYGLDVELAWFKPSGQQARHIVRSFQVLGEWRSAHKVRVRVARDYQVDGSGNPIYFDDFLWSPNVSTLGAALQLRHGPSQKRCQAMKIRLTAVNATGSLPTPGVPDGEALRLTGLALDVATEPGFTTLPASQRT